jgi:hypothetical protein
MLLILVRSAEAEIKPTVLDQFSNNTHHVLERLALGLGTTGIHAQNEAEVDYILRYLEWHQENERRAAP